MRTSPLGDAYVIDHPDGEAYHQFAWKAAVERAYSYRGMYLIAERQHRILGGGGNVVDLSEYVHDKSPI